MALVSVMVLRMGAVYSEYAGCTVSYRPGYRDYVTAVPKEGIMPGGSSVLPLFFFIPISVLLPPQKTGVRLLCDVGQFFCMNEG